MAKIPKVILLVESSRESGRALLRGIASYAYHHGPWSFYWEPAGLEKGRRSPVELEADGVIARDVDMVPREKGLVRRLPGVVIGHQHTEVPGKANVVTDSAAIAGMAAEHLLGCGFRYFGYCGYRNTSWSAARRDVFASKIREAGFEVRMHEVHEVRPDGIAQTRRGAPVHRPLAAIGSRPIGLMACNDDLGKEIVEACRQAGLGCLTTWQSSGRTTTRSSGLSSPPLSSVAINFERAGYEAAGVLDHLMRGARRVPERIMVRASHVVPRQSTDILAVEDAGLAKALRFIRDHARTGATVEATARAAGLSRRVSEKRDRNI